MTAMSEPLVIDYYTDVLCVWAWISQRRLKELREQWGGAIRLQHHCVNVFGDTRSKIARQWSDRGGLEGFAAHVQEAAAGYENAATHPDLWRRVCPSTSATAHALLKAAGMIESVDAMTRLADAIRHAFFVEALDIGQLDQLLPVAEAVGLSADSLVASLRSGEAMAALLSDYTTAEQQGIKGSPSWVMNQGRQILYGNVGYRILHANVEELLRHPEQEASWC
jgi:predicted DsbA family dithiol-disulfide isomerase